MRSVTEEAGLLVNILANDGMTPLRPHSGSLDISFVPQVRETRPGANGYNPFGIKSHPSRKQKREQENRRNLAERPTSRHLAVTLHLDEVGSRNRDNYPRNAPEGQWKCSHG